MGAPEEIAALLCQRGIDSPDAVRMFFNPKIEDLHDPFLMRDMEQAIDRIDKAIESKEKLMVFGDYDVDGTTSVSTVFQFFRDYFDDIIFYIPDRYKEGYGISKQGIDKAKEEGISLIIALDCGIRSVELIDYAAELGIDFIICDHHLPGEEIPQAVAVLDPKRKDCEYPYKELCGCGIGFKLIQAFCQKHDLDDRLYQRYLDLVCLAIASDIVPITGENRVLAYYGLKLVNARPSLGIRKLIEKSIQKEELSIGDLVFYVGPRINAAGRMDSAELAVKLLTTEDELEADVLATELHAKNAHRKTVDEKITADLQEIVAKNPELLSRKTLVFFDPSWHKGVIGIAASRAIELYHRPTIILTGSEGKLSGSGRSIKGFDLHEALHHCSDHLIQFGGHMYAAGLTMKEENLDAFSAAFEEVAQMELSEDDMLPRLMYDQEIQVDDISDKTLKIIQRMAPFGPGNLTPVFRARNLLDDGSGRVIGSTAEHIRLNIKQESGSIAAVGFGMADQFDAIKKADSFEACFTINENIFRGMRSIQLMLKGIRPTNDTGNISSVSS
ncbi:single-stranded-DNA-specific exonuclease RecJ [bacterium]|nr:single-stranded-DNA-specific exonuclease RecJ [bacterium]